MRNIILIASIVFSMEAFGGVLFSDDFEGISRLGSERVVEHTMALSFLTHWRPIMR